MDLIFTLAIAAGLGLIPANIAKKKGYDFTLWWIYGWLLFIVAIIHAILLKDKNEPSVYSTGAADELIKYKELLDKGIITQEEFDKKKNEILR